MWNAKIAQIPWMTIVLSWLGSGFLSAWLSGRYALRAKHSEFVNDYYKTVIQRRIAAYEDLEQLILQMRVAVLDESDNRTYHLAFSGSNLSPFMQARIQTMARSLWLSDEVFNKLRELDILLIGLTEQGQIEFGKKHYRQIAALGAELRRLLAADMLHMYDVERFLRAKNRPDPGFQTVDFGQNSLG